MWIIIQMPVGRINSIHHSAKQWLHTSATTRQKKITLRLLSSWEFHPYKLVYCYDRKLDRNFQLKREGRVKYFNVLSRYFNDSEYRGDSQKKNARNLYLFLIYQVARYLSAGINVPPVKKCPQSLPPMANKKTPQLQQNQGSKDHRGVRST